MKRIRNRRETMTVIESEKIDREKISDVDRRKTSKVKKRRGSKKKKER